MRLGGRPSANVESLRPRHQVQVAVLGAGQWGSNLIRTFYELGALAAVAEPDALRRSRVAEHHPDVRTLSRPEDVWSLPVPAVAIATPAPTHFKLAREALEAGKHVFVERPLTLTARDAEELVRIAEERGRTLMVGHLLLY